MLTCQEACSSNSGRANPTVIVKGSDSSRPSAGCTSMRVTAAIAQFLLESCARS